MSINVRQEMRRPPRPRGLPFLGNVPRLRRDPLGAMTEWARTHGDVVGLRLAIAQGFLISHPDDIEHVLVTANRSFVKPWLLRQAGEMLGDGLLTSDGELWLRQRRLMSPPFHRERIASYGGAMVELTERMLDGWRDGEVLDLHEEMMHLTLAIVARTLFGSRVDDVAEDVGWALEIALKRFVDRIGPMRLLDRLPLPRNRRFASARDRLDAIIFRLIRERRATTDPRTDLLGMLLDATDEEGRHMSDRQLRDEAITLFLAGHETTAIALSWTWMLLALNPEVERKLLDELDDVLRGVPPTVEDLPRLRYTAAVIRESMRLYPPAWRIGREAIQECEIGGYPVPIGSQVIMSQWVVHRDPRFFAEPERFLPERWEANRAAALPKFAYFPFGGGARRCIGDTFAIMEAALVLATVARRFRLAPAQPTPIEIWPSITLRPRTGILMRPCERIG